MKVTVMLILLILTLTEWANAQLPNTNKDFQWDYLIDYSDEFNTGTLDSKWNNNVGDWGTWSWEPENAYIKDTLLTLKMQHSPHHRGGTNYYFTSGIARIDKTITYGYFEAKIKAQETWPSGAPAFWLYSVGQPTPTEEGGVQYSEIDVVEIFQVNNKIHDIEMNLHTRIIENGELTWKRPGQGNSELHNNWVAPWDPRDDFHTYGVMSRKDSIFWYVDGVERGRKANTYWHLPMHVTVSLGLRSPYEKYVNGERTIVETPNAPDGFPTEMYCDYVRVWQAPPQIVVDQEKYENGEYGQGLSMNFEYAFDAGSGYLVSDQRGLTVRLLEKDNTGHTVNEISATDSQIAGLAAGKSSVKLPIPESVKLTSELPSGNYYALTAEFESTKDGGVTVTLEEIKDIQIKDASEILNAKNVENGGWFVYPNPANSFISFGGISSSNFEIQIFNLSGVQVLQKRLSDHESFRFNIEELPAGIYMARIQDGVKSESLRFAKVE